MGKQVLVLSNDSFLYSRLFSQLQGHGIDVAFSPSGDAGLERFIQGDFCLVIMELVLKNEDGFNILRLMKRTSSIPILILSSSLTVEKCIKIFQSGADVCLEKSVDISICVAQALSLIRLCTEMKYLKRTMIPISFGSDFLIIPESHQVLIKSTPIELTRLEFDVLFYLASNRNRVLSSEEIYRQVWGIHNGPPANDAVKSVIKNLRRKLQPIPRILIRNVRGIGYRLIYEE